jgi:hypothetical protein
MNPEEFSLLNFLNLINHLFIEVIGDRFKLERLLFSRLNDNGFTDLLVLVASQIDMFRTNIDGYLDKGREVDPRLLVVGIV